VTTAGQRRKLGRSLALIVILSVTTLAPAAAASSGPTVATLQGIRDELVALRPAIDRSYSYAFYFDASAGKLEVQTDAPVSVFASLASKHPDLIEIKTAVLGLDSGRLADSPPRSGAGPPSTTGLHCVQAVTWPRAQVPPTWSPLATALD